MQRRCYALYKKLDARIHRADYGVLPKGVMPLKRE
jgi:hypothetical protein